MASPQIGRKLYATAFWLLLIPAVLLVGYALVLATHDSIVKASAFGCWDHRSIDPQDAAAYESAITEYIRRRRADPYSAPPDDAVDRMVAESQVSAPARWVDDANRCGVYGPTRAEYADGCWIDGERGFGEWAEASKALVALLPITILVVGRRWLNWLLRPES